VPLNNFVISYLCFPLYVKVAHFLSPSVMG
jgi:hypothetical protein